ncbi:MAG: ATP-binding protein [Bacteroidia bacterium]|nr:ATP-binding protein [Bacteroidia bacterium]
MLTLPKNIYQRSAYLDKIKPFINKGLIKVITGQRRVGKSYLLFQIMELILTESPEAEIIYINKEDLQFSAITNAEELNNYVLERKNKNGFTYVFVDEIQDIEQFELALRSLLLLSDIDLYITGSNANLLAQDIAGVLSGRSIEIVVHSLSYPEFLEFHQLADESNSLEMFMKYGGLPFLRNLELTDLIVFEYLKNIYHSIIYKDIINRYEIRNVPFLEQLVTFLAGNIGSIFSAKKIADFLKSQQTKISPNQVQIFVNYLSNAFLIHVATRFDIQGKRVFEIGEKYYYENLGIRNALWGYKIQDKGKIIENIVYNHLLFKGYKVHVGSLGSEEIDFYCIKDNEICYIQVALSISEEKTIQREFGNLSKIKDNYPKIVITLDPFEGNTYEGIQIFSLRNFLLNYEL